MSYRRSSLALVSLAALAAASIPESEPMPPEQPKSGYQPGGFRYRNVKKSYARTLAARLRKPHREVG